MRRLSQILPVAVDQTEVLKAARAQMALKSWHNVVGSILSQRSAPDRFDHGTLWVSATGSAWAQEVRMAKDTILARLNAEAGERLFTDLRVGVRPPRRTYMS